MNEVLKIEGGKILSGKIKVSGSKNSIVALIPASIMADGVVSLYGVAGISDVTSLVKILGYLGVSVVRKPGFLKIDTTGIHNTELRQKEISMLRASYYFMGALLGRYKKVEISVVGGCDLGERPIDLHIKGFKSLGAEVSFVRGIYQITAEKLKGAHIYLDFSSVGATINIMMAAVLAEGKTIIENAAKEPEIIDVASLLNKMGAKIRGAGTNSITIEGVTTLGSCTHEIIPDRIEAATYIILAAAIGRDILVRNIIPQHLESLLSKLQEMGVDLEINPNSVLVRGGKQLKGVDIKTQVYPGFPTDVQQPLTTLLLMSEGSSTVTDTIYPQRFKHCQELNKLGADIINTPQMSIINGPKKLMGNTVYATDLRCGAALVIAALVAEGITEIRNIYHIERGYENIVRKLRKVGAQIWKEKVS